MDQTAQEEFGTGRRFHAPWQEVPLFQGVSGFGENPRIDDPRVFSGKNLLLVPELSHVQNIRQYALMDSLRSTGDRGGYALSSSRIGESVNLAPRPLPQADPVSEDCSLRG